MMRAWEHVNGRSTVGGQLPRDNCTTLAANFELPVSIGT
jgi:hypothetical protein